MRYKVLTVDDSKTVRVIVKKAFKAHLNLDVTVHPAKARRTDTGSKLSTVMITCEVEP